jgi:sugar phosphate isomerase/epimerase
MQQPIAIQSWCFRHFKQLADFFPQLKSAGVTATELCGVHATFTEPDTAADTLAAFNKAGVKIVAIGVEYLTGDYAKDKPRFEWCRNAGVRHMSISFKPESLFDGLKNADSKNDGLKNIEKLADEFDLQLGIHNHGGYDWLGNPTMLKFIFERTSKRIGLHLDTAWAIDAKQNPVEMAEQFIDRLVGVHIKDFVYDRLRNPSDVIIGTGILDLPRFMKVLKSAHFAGPLVIEYEGDVENPVPALAECVKKLDALRA